MRWTLHLLACWAALSAGMAHAQSEDVHGPVGPVPVALPELRLPDVRDVHIPVPRQVRAAQAAVGMGRQRLALVVGLGTVGSRLVVDSAPRDAQAVSAALRSGGFVVMLREDVSAADLRTSLKEFSARLLPGGVGFIYVTGLGVQLDGRNLLLARDTPLDAALAPAALALHLRAAAVPLDEFAQALVGTNESPRMLVVDAAFKHPALLRLAPAGLALQRLEPGVMALFGQALGSLQEVPAVAPLPQPAPTDPTALAATPFARVLAGALLKARISGPEALRATRRALVDATLGQHSPWIGGDTDANEELAEATLLDGLVPRTPEELAREGLRQGSRLISRPSAARGGEQSVAEVLQQNSVPAAAPPAEEDSSDRKPPRNPRAEPQAPGASGLGSTLGSAASAVGTVASLAATTAAAGVAVQAAEAQAVASVSSSAVGAAGSAVSNVVAMASRAGGAATCAAASGTTAPPPAPAAPPSALVTAPAQPAPALPHPAPAAPLAEPPPTVAPAAPTAAAMAAPPAAPAAAPSAAPVPDGRTQRQPGGGERPAYLPRTNSFGYAEGDTFTYQVIDIWRGEVVGQTTTAVEEVLGNGHLLANGQQVAMDPQGRLTKVSRDDGSGSQFQPCQDLWWSNPRRGESRSVKFVETFQRAGGARGTTEWKGSTSAGSLRTVKLPAGEFLVMPMESSGWWYETLANGARSSGQWSRTVWYAPALGHPVAIDLQDADRLGKLLKRERVELLHAQSARSAP